MKRSTLLVLSLSLLAVSAMAPRSATAQGPPGLSELELILESSRLRVASSSQPLEGPVAWLGVARHPREIYQEVQIHRQLTAGGEPGRLDVPEGVPLRSAWVVVDGATGAVGWAFPEGFPGAVRPLPPGALVADGAGPEDTGRGLALPHRVLEVLLVRPAADGGPAGAWGGRIGDGGQRDRDGRQDGAVEARLEDLVAVPAVPGDTAPGDTAPGAPTTPEEELLPPDRLRPGDVLVAIDPGTLEVYWTRLGPPLQASSGRLP